MGAILDLLTIDSESVDLQAESFHSLSPSSYCCFLSRYDSIVLCPWGFNALTCERPLYNQDVIRPWKSGHIMGRIILFGLFHQRLLIEDLVLGSD